MNGTADLIRELSDLTGPSGQEGPIRSRLRELVAPDAEQLHEDALGSLFVHLRGERGREGRRLLILVPMDEAAVVVTHVDEHGRAAVAALGTLLPAAVAGCRVRFASGAVAAGKSVV